MGSPSWAIDQPVSTLGEFGDVGLAIAAVDADRMQLKHLAGKVFVEAAPVAQTGRTSNSARPNRHCRDRAASPDAPPPRPAGYAEIVRVTLGRMASFSKPTATGNDHRALDRDGEMVRPELHQPLEERCRRCWRHPECASPRRHCGNRRRSSSCFIILASVGIRIAFALRAFEERVQAGPMTAFPLPRGTALGQAAAAAKHAWIGRRWPSSSPGPAPKPKRFAAMEADLEDPTCSGQSLDRGDARIHVQTMPLPCAHPIFIAFSAALPIACLEASIASPRVRTPTAPGAAAWFRP